MRSNKINVLVAVIAMALGVGACGSTGSDPTTTEPNPATGVGPGISVEEAIAVESDQPLLVNGFLIVDSSGQATLSSALAESAPPQAAGATLVVEGVDFDTYELTESQGVRWSDDQVQVLGVVSDGTLVGSGTTSG